MADRDTFDPATRTAAGDKRNYDNVWITLHWLTAFLVVTQFALAETWDWFSSETREGMESTHVSLGMLLTAVVVTRLIWRSMPSHRRSPLAAGWMLTASKAVHYVLYLLLVAQAGLGFGWRWAQGHPVEFFGLFGIPGPYGELGRPTRHIFHDLHEFIGWAIVIIAFGHALAALYHHYRLHDRVLGRMFPPARKSEAAYSRNSLTN